MAKRNLPEPPDYMNDIPMDATTTTAPAAVEIFTPPPRIDLSEFFAEPEPFDFVLPGLLLGTVGAIVSPGGAGKSMFALQAASAIAGGPDLLGLNLINGKVAYLPAEDPTIALHHRVFALSKRWSMPERQRVRDNLALHSLIGTEPDLFSAHWFDWIESLLDGKRLLIIDTLRRFHKLDENDSGQMAGVISQMEVMAWRKNCCIVFLHHSSKSAVLGGQSDMQQASRGSSVLVDNIRWQMFLAGMTDKEAKENGVDADLRRNFVRVGVSKQNYGSPHPEAFLRRSEGGILVPAEFATSFVTMPDAAPRQKTAKNYNGGNW